MGSKLRDNKMLSAELLKVVEKKKYKIWAEGFSATGDYGTAHFMGEAYGRDFKDACENLFAGDSLFDATRMTHWGCELFDNEADARKSYG